MKTKISSKEISHSLEEVWDWKEQVYQEVKDKTFEEKQKVYSDALQEAANILHSKLLRNENGTYRFV
jgi:shikimate kinase